MALVFLRALASLRAIFLTSLGILTLSNLH